MIDSVQLPPFVFAIVGYAFVLIAALVVVNVLLHRLTKRERSGRRRGPGPRG
jgi:uncharacterized membrane protein